MANLETRIGPLCLPNPVLTASGTFGYGDEMASWLDLSRLGGIVCKTVTRAARAGNAPPRTCETPGGMLNAIGLQNVGLERFCEEKLPFLRQCGAPLIVNIAGETVEDFAFLCRALSQQAGIAAIELNISCPNVAHGLDFATDAALAEDVVAHARRATDLPLFAKLSPNVTDISLIARAAHRGGADALCVANTFVGLAVDVKTRRPRLSNITGGLSGPAIKPLALRAVWRCAGAVPIPIIGIGGIASPQDALEFLIAGASAVQVGTATFSQPDATLSIIEGINEYLDENKFSHVKDIVGSINAN
ncbi:dihydroorotate oxidase B, catalytic subunit [Abditibacterium utsteinense]|uniref:Dihydroorotate dehydrogenase n=1 Tax=Abditibacterium utsteinense TaxID=1960156 RepID=A0A2S8SSG4_9BACT|nr:dihydroorotate dehydrogenase [Abditibacterium utsteinense]PQV63741.1 dihydroorotate oxidase B, catalytic subunit [Abditibacterium utsteinense]